MKVPKAAWAKVYIYDFAGCCNKIDFRSYIVLGSAFGGSCENESGIVFNLQITIQYFHKLF